MSRLLSDNGDVLLLNRDLACVKDMGVTKALILQQIHYWIDHNKKGFLNELTHDKYSNIYQLGRFWTYVPVDKLQKENFPFWSEKTIRRNIDSLIEQNYLIVEKFNEKNYDQTNWYTINYEKMAEIEKEIDDLKAIREVDKLAQLQEKKRKKLQNEMVKNDEKASRMAEMHIRTKCPNGSGQNDQINVDKMTEPIQEINTRDLTKDLSIVVSNIESNVLQDQITELLGFINGAFKRPIGRTNKAKFIKLVKQYGYDYVKRIIQYCYFNKFKTFSYFETVFTAYVEQGVVTVECLNIEIEKGINARISKDKSKYLNPYKFNNFESRDRSEQNSDGYMTHEEIEEALLSQLRNGKEE